MVANNVEEPHMGASQDKLSDSSAASSDASHITEHSPSIFGKLEYLRGAPEPSTTPLIADRSAVELQESLQACDSSSAVASTPRESEELRELPSVSPNEESHATERPSSPKPGKKGTSGWIKYTECQKAFILHHGRDCSWDYVATKFEAQFGTDRPVDRVRLVHLRRYLVKTEQEQTLLNDATTYDWYTAVPAKINAEVEEQIRHLTDCNEEQQAFLVYHAIKGVTYLRIVEVFNQQFGTAVSFDVLDGLLLESRRKGNEPDLLVAAAHYDWYKKYLPKRAPPGKKASGPLWIGKEIESPDPGLEPERSISHEPKSKAKTVTKIRQAFSHEQLSYLAWMSRRIRYNEPLSEGFRARFGAFPDEWKVSQQITRLRRDPDWVDILLDGVESYAWYQPDFKSHEVGYGGQELLRVRAEARRRLKRGVKRFAPPADGSPIATQSQAPLSSPSSLSSGNPPIKGEDTDRDGVSPLRNFGSLPRSATLGVSRPSPEALPNILNPEDSRPKTADTDADDSPELLFARPIAACSTRNVNRVKPAVARPTCGHGRLQRTEPLQQRRVVGEEGRTNSAPRSGFEAPRRSAYIPGVRRAAMPSTVATTELATANGPRFAAIDTAPLGLPDDFVEVGFEPISCENSVLHTQQLQGDNIFRTDDTMQFPRHNASEMGYREIGPPADQTSDNTFGRSQVTSAPSYGLNEDLGGGTSLYHDSNYYPMALPPSHQILQPHASGGYQSASSHTSLSTQYFDSRIHGSSSSLHMATPGHAVGMDRQTTTYAGPYSQQRPSQHGNLTVGFPRENVISASPFQASSYALSYGQHHSHPSPQSQHWVAGCESRPGQAHARAQQDYPPAQYHQVGPQHDDPAQYHHQSRPKHPLQYGHPSSHGSRPSHVYGYMELQPQPAAHQPRRHNPHGLSQHDLSQIQPSSVVQQRRTLAQGGFNNAVRRQRIPRDAVDLGSVSQGSQRSASPDKAERNRHRDFW